MPRTARAGGSLLDPEIAGDAGAGGSGAGTQKDIELAVYRQALERSRTDMQSFAHSVSHDLRAPLRAIQGFSKILLEDYSAELDEEARHFLEHIIHNTQLLTAQMDDLLRFSRAGKAPPSRTELEAAELVQQTIEDLRPELPENFRVTVRDLPKVFGDPTLLRQALSEIICNAAKFTAMKPEPKLEIFARTDDHSVTLIFRDNGVGFSPAHSAKLFQVFQKLHSLKEYPGNGIGLAIVKRIIEAHGGCVEARGGLNAGAEIAVSLPRADWAVPLECLPPEILNRLQP